MKHYVGRLVGPMCWRVDVLGATPTKREFEFIGPLDPCTEILNHSPDGLSWGYGGSGPAQLALALLVDTLGDVERAKRLYTRFAQQTTYKFAGTQPWILSEQQVNRAADLIDRPPMSPVLNTTELNLVRNQRG